MLAWNVPFPHGFQLRLLVVLALIGLVTNGAHAQSDASSRADSVLRRILARFPADGYHPLRIASRVGGRFQGHALLVRGDTVVLIGRSNERQIARGDTVVLDRSSERQIALADIDSVWVRRDAGRGLGMVFGGLCAIIVGGFGAVMEADPDSGNGSALPAFAIGAALGGVICGGTGWLVGSLIQTWRLEYPVPVKSRT